MKKVHKKHFFYSENKTKKRTGGGRVHAPPYAWPAWGGGGHKLGV